jgi:hypothetical protein
MVSGDTETLPVALTPHRHLDNDLKTLSWFHSAWKVLYRVRGAKLYIAQLLTLSTGVTGKGRIWNWYQTSFEVPSSWPSGNNVILNFGAVDYEATIFVNGKKAGFHRGGYFEFSVDVTPHLNANGTNEL